MTAPTDPYAPPSTAAPAVMIGAPPPAEPPIHTFRLTSLQRAEWNLAIYSDVLQLTADDGRASRSIHRQAFLQSGLLAHLAAWRQLVVRKPAPSVGFALRPDVVAALRNWMAPYCRQQMVKTLASWRPTAVFLGILSLIPVGRHGVDPVQLVVGVAWLAWAGAATWKPFPGLFAALAILWLESAVQLASRALQGSLGWLALAPIFLWLIATHLRSYLFYRSLPATLKA